MADKVIQTSYPYPEFYKLYVPDHSSDMLHVPPSFVNYLYGLGKKLPDKIILRTSSRRHHQWSRIWDVEVNQRENEADGVFFKHGWGNFVRDLSLELSDLLTFRFDGDRTFYVTVFGASMTEKTEDFESSDDDDGDGGDDEDDEIDAKRFVGLKKKKKNPYFVTKVKAGVRKAFCVPTKVLKALEDGGYKLEEKVVIRDSKDEKEWTANVTSWTDGRVWIKGWQGLYKKKGSAVSNCICEFVLEDGENTVNLIHVHILEK